MLDTLFTPTHLILFFIALAIYLAPALIAIRNDHPNRTIIILINIFLGGTGLAWLAVLYWAFHPQLVLRREGGAEQV